MVREYSSTKFATRGSPSSKYVKNVKKGSLGWVFMVLRLIHRLDVYLKPLFLAHVKRIYINILLIYSQMKFQLYQSHSLTAIGLKSGKKSIKWVSVGSLETSM